VGGVALNFCEFISYDRAVTMKITVEREREREREREKERVASSRKFQQ